MGNKYTRHTLQLLSLPSLIRRTRDVPIYAADMYGRPLNIGADPTAGITANGAWQSFDPITTQGICASVNIPYDRVSGTDIKFYFVYTVPTPPGGGVIMWRLDYLVRGEGNLINVAPTQMHLPTLANFSTFLAMDRSASIIIPAWIIDGQWALGHPVEFHLGFIREAAHLADTEASAAYLLKVVMEYQSNY